MSTVKFIFIGILFTLISCKVEPQKINYGQDHCAFCEMTVVDKTHASEYVTKKGKSYIFDSIECMVQKINEENNEGELAYILVANYQKPGELINAQNSTYLITKKIKSPMGAYLSAFSSFENAEKVKNELDGKIYNWQQLKEKFKD
ncbi:MAG: nitrous oxide reductase accessory protein NosL [Lutibacter sp.]|uniref:nitrous oxide reductase accessory protein NosL n=1 Tax=Lutibacter sp. TaxID=1925666 RepID=UPI00299D1216|nr:nitrous oxide reductase accessory protein NosL [Lutibacter sp.]MDX1829493.1 nitrous oxide reductase accessory protein NosL [Lutibacter sp.]